MKSFRTAALIVLGGLFTASHAQSPSAQNISSHSRQTSQAHRSRGLQGLHFPPSTPLRFLASEEGRAFLRATGHQLAQYAIQAFGEPAKETVVPARWLQLVAAASQQPANAAAAVPCTGNSGTRFNLEPRQNAWPQNQASADFLPNRIGPADDLIVQAANDWRGNLTTGVRWDQSVSGYYVHRSTTADCSVQFEGGLPAITVQGSPQLGIGGVAVAADPERDAIFLVDQRFGSLSGEGLFRALASTLLDPTKCPNGTHSEAQATSCWGVTPPAFIFSQPGPDLGGVQPSVAVDERPTGAGKGAGDVYVVGSRTVIFQPSAIAIVACTNSLNCGTGAGITISGSDSSVAFPSVRVRTDGVITVSYINTNTDGTADIKFVTCTPTGAPKAPVCTAPHLVQHIAEPIAPNAGVLQDMVNVNLIAFTYPKHADRAESGGKFTSLVVYDDCKNPFVQGNPPFTVCLNAEVVMTTSTDNGKTWSKPVSVDSATGHHFYPAITTDPSTGIVNIAYYSTEGDRFNHEVRVLRNQINPGGTAVGTPQMVTKILDPIDGDPGGLGALQTDAYMGVIARGTGVSGKSRLYVSFDSTAVTGTYEGHAAPELNNSIAAVSF